MRNNRVFWEGMAFDGKIIKEVFRNCAKTEYLLLFTDKTWKVVYTNDRANKKSPIFKENILNYK